MKNMQEKLTNSSVPMAAESQRELTVASNQIELLTNLERKCAAKHAAFDPRSSSIMFKHSAGDGGMALQTLQLLVLRLELF